MSTIADTVNGNLPRGAEKYRNHIDRGIALLVEREQSIVAALLDYAGSKGASDAEVRNLFDDLDLAVPDPEPASLEDRVTAVEDRLERAIAAARSRGLHVV